MKRAYESQLLQACKHVFQTFEDLSTSLLAAKGMGKIVTAGASKDDGPLLMPSL